MLLPLTSPPGTPMPAKSPEAAVAACAGMYCPSASMFQLGAMNAPTRPPYPIELPKSVFSPHLLSNFVPDPNAPTSNVPGDCAAADPPRSKAVIAQTVQLLLNMIVSSQRVEILCSGYRGCTLRREAGCMPSERSSALQARPSHNRTN